MSGADDLTACAGLVARGDPVRFRATMAAPVALRRMLFPLYAFNLEVARAPRVTQEPLIAQMRLQWWADALEEIAAGGKVRRHEVVTPLADVLDSRAADALQAVVTARQADVERDVPVDLSDVLTYVDGTAGVLMRVAARLAGEPREEAAAAAGRAQGIAALLLAVPTLAAEGRHPLPHGDPSDFAARLAREGRDGIYLARTIPVAPAARPVFLGLTEAEATLRRFQADPSLVLEDRPREPGFGVRAGMAMRALLNRV
ncbi:squalene/phytoene synthase family protein [Jannaschia pohangensis]|uniref:Squalene/phytoene synthase n=1 Tax=Jannaschia pohangensis TaxID=390807 RepID=A0A1I3GNY7_9RHOB|nr:squalene/phytoene synthase family protein [Jannaschia pohangensis]SFI25083.1 Squalene/phytoene synthase [Jannaschia pohangensis]